MANAKMTIKTPLAPLSWVNISGQGKLKMNAEDNGLPENYSYTATATLTEEQAKLVNEKIDKFWKDNKPSGIGKRKFELVKKEMVKVMGDDGKPVLDADDEPVKEWTGKYTIQAKTLTHWPKDGKQNIVKLLGSQGQTLPEDHPAREGVGQGTMGIIHGSLGISAYGGNEGVVFYLNGVQLKESTFVPYAGDEIEAESLEDEVQEVEVETEGEMPAV